MTEAIHNIVSELYTDRRVKELISKQEPVDLQGDLLHHCVLELYRLAEQYPGKLEEIHAKGEMWAYFTGMVRLQMHSAKSTFYTRFRRQMVSIDEIDYLSIKDEVKEKDSYGHFEAIVARFGFDAAKGMVNEIEKQEEARIANFGEKKKVVKFEQLKLF